MTMTNEEHIERLERQIKEATDKIRELLFRPKETPMEYHIITEENAGEVLGDLAKRKLL